MKKILCILLPLITFSPIAISEGSKELSADMYGDEWPLKVESGVVKCLPDNAVVFQVGESVYAINGLARGYAKKYGYLSVNPIWKEDQSFYKMAQEIADADPNSTVEEVLKKMGTMPKIDIGPILDTGVELCD